MRNIFKPLEIVYDEENDVVVIEGVKYHADIFRILGGAFNPGVTLKFKREDNGVLIVTKVGENL